MSKPVLSTPVPGSSFTDRALALLPASACRAGVKLERGACIKASAMSEKAYPNSLRTLQNALGIRYHLSRTPSTVLYETRWY